MLILFCNLIEVIRLRERLIADVTESKILSEVFDTLKDLANKGGLNQLAKTPIPFHQPDGSSSDHVNFFDDGTLTGHELDLAVNEFDSTLKANLNFMNSESVQCLVLDNGLA